MTSSEDEGGDDGEDEGEDDGEDEGEDDGEDEYEDDGEDDGENSGKENDKESDEDAGKAKVVGVDEDIEMVDINKVEARVSTAGMANTIEVTTSEGE